ncbi:MAG: Lrp/AsnC family transcriptional regulator [Firmicutes bacterium]|nr:Lrp/AsnC family transcriptional regulator [Bacillota bacterium]
MKVSRKDILNLLEKNAKLTAGEIAVLIGAKESEVASEIKKLEDEKVICGYGAFVNWEREDDKKITALIEVKVTPSRGEGFSRIAERIYKFSEVKATYLMSGAYDLAVIIEGRTLGEVAGFVSDKLAPLDSILSTATHFVLKKYKDHGIIFNDKEGAGERQLISP